VKDPHKYEACRHLWAVVLATNTKDAVKSQLRALEGKPKPGTDADMRWIASRHFLEVCRLAGMDDGSEMQRRIIERTNTLEGCAALLELLDEGQEKKRDRLRRMREGTT
jgi:hypothetical protein